MGSTDYEVTVTIKQEPGWVADVVIGEDERVVSLTIRAVNKRSRAEGITSRLLRRLRLDDLLDAVRRMRPPDPLLEAARLLPRARLTAGVERTNRRPGPRGYSDRFFAERAREYVDLLAQGVRDPVQRMAERHSYGESTVRGWLQRARDDGYLTHPDRAGRPGGKLTDDGLDVLKGAT